LENEGTVDGTYSVIEEIFINQFKYDPEKDFDDSLQLMYGDQKSISLVQTVQKERLDSEDSYEKLNWILAVPGLFHWRTNYIDMINDIYKTSVPNTLVFQLLYITI
jgi:hypothetical protein